MNDRLLHTYLVIRNRASEALRRDEGVETLEVIAIMALIVILIGAMTSIFKTGGDTIATIVINGIKSWAEKIKGG